jgi:hypothetical protein
MSDRSNFYYEQEVTEAEMDQAFDDLENADHDLLVDHDTWGVLTGLAVTQSGTADLFINISTGVAYDETGRRIPMATSGEKIDMTSYLPTTNPKWVRVYIQSDIIESDSRLDGLGTPVNYRQTESWDWVIDEGTEGGGVPTLLADHVLLCQIQLTVGMTQIFQADIDDDWTAGERQEGGITVIHGRTNAKGPLLFDGTVSIVGLDDLGTDTVTLTSGSGTGIDTQGKDVLLGTGKLNGEAGNAVQCTEVQAGAPVPATPAGHTYTNPATGALVDISKYLSVSAGQMLPGEQATDPWSSTGLNEWRIRETAKSPYSLAGDIAWAIEMQYAAAGDGIGLYIPLVGLPEGAKLISAKVGYSVVTAGMHASQNLALYLLRRSQAAVDAIGPAPTNQRQGSVGNYTWSESYTAGATQIVNGNLYGYYLAVVPVATNNFTSVGENIRIKFASVLYHVREASGVY